MPNTNFYRAPEHGDDLEAFGLWAANRIEEAIEFEGPETVAAVFLEPVQNSGGCFPPPPGYFQRVREICDEHDVLLVSDEVICAFGRIGSMFGTDFGYQPDIITCAKGMTSGYSPIGAMIASDRLFEPFKHGDTSFAHGYTFGGHPVSAAVAMANLDIFEREGLNEHVLAAAPGLPRRSRSCATCPSSATCAATATSTASSWSRTRPPRRPSTTTSPSGCCAASCPRRCSTPALLPGRRPRRPGHPARAAAHLRPVALRRDGADPALGPDRGMGRLVDRTAVRRLPEKQLHDRAFLDAVLDAGRVAHVAVGDDEGQPYVIPVAYARDADRVLFHGSTGSRLFRSLAAGAPTCLTVTLLDGLVLARSAFESSMHYRCAMVLGSSTTLEGDEKLAGLERISEHLMPGRWADARQPNRKELAATLVLSMPLAEWSVKVSDGPPDDAEDDLGLPVWAGTLPLHQRYGDAAPAPDLRPGLELPGYVRDWTPR